MIAQSVQGLPGYGLKNTGRTEPSRAGLGIQRVPKFSGQAPESDIATEVSALRHRRYNTCVARTLLRGVRAWAIKV
jgi:hypothetical protein